jgi:hypothetical protein
VKDITVFSGSAHPGLAEEICGHLDTVPANGNEIPIGIHKIHGKRRNRYD